jgi:hypothetical protein
MKKLTLTLAAVAVCMVAAISVAAVKDGTITIPLNRVAVTNTVTVSQYGTALDRFVLLNSGAYATDVTVSAVDITGVAGAALLAKTEIGAAASLEVLPTRQLIMPNGTTNLLPRTIRDVQIICAGGNDDTNTTVGAIQYFIISP